MGLSDFAANQLKYNTATAALTSWLTAALISLSTAPGYRAKPRCSRRPQQIRRSTQPEQPQAGLDEVQLQSLAKNAMLIHGKSLAFGSGAHNEK